MQSDMTVEQFEALCNLAREFNEYIAPERTYRPANAPSDAHGDRPGDDFNRRGTWAEVLDPHGWKAERSSGVVTYWTRSGKDGGTSATTGKCSSEIGGDLLYVFSSNAEPFECDSAYSKFSAFALLNHAGDFPAAAKAILLAGYGETKPEPSVVFGKVPLSEQPDDGIPPDFDFATNEDMKRLNINTRWIWKDWLQDSTVNLLAAEGGLGKTRWIADLCRRVCLSLGWPDGTETPAFDGKYIAMWVAGDRNHPELVTLSEDFGFGDRICYSGSKNEPMSGVTLNTASDFSALYRRVKAARPLFLVIDTAGGTTSFNMAKQEEARAFFAPLSDIAAKLGLCVIVITHLNASKQTLGRRAEERVRCVIRMSADNKEPTTPRRIEVVKSNGLFPQPLGMMLTATGSTYGEKVPASPEEQKNGGAGGGGGSDGPERGPPTKCRECMEWLSERLETAPERVAKLIGEGETAGFSKGLIYKAKGAIKIIETTDSKSHKWWGLNNDPQTNV